MKIRGLKFTRCRINIVNSFERCSTTISLLTRENTSPVCVALDHADLDRYVCCADAPCISPLRSTQRAPSAASLRTTVPSASALPASSDSASAWPQRKAQRDADCAVESNPLSNASSLTLSLCLFDSLCRLHPLTHSTAPPPPCFPLCRLTRPPSLCGSSCSSRCEDCCGLSTQRSFDRQRTSERAMSGDTRQSSGRGRGRVRESLDPTSADSFTLLSASVLCVCSG